MSDSFENSAGCIWNGPSENHDCAPFDVEPSGEMTAINMMVVTP